MIDLDRITSPLRLAKGSHQEGSGKGCAMNVISYINGDTAITDFPSCSARPLARLVQLLNDRLASPDGFLSPENAVIVLDLGWQTVGTADVPKTVELAWLAELLDSPEWGVSRFTTAKSRPAIRAVADLLRTSAAGGTVSNEEWMTARQVAAYAAYAAADAASAYAAADAAAYAAYAAAAESFTKSAISAWRRLAGLDTQTVDHDALNLGLSRANA
jgi:hypothetical protein